MESICAASSETEQLIPLKVFLNSSLSAKLSNINVLNVEKWNPKSRNGINR